jgi:hypothetical protein
MRSLRSFRVKICYTALPFSGEIIIRERGFYKGGAKETGRDCRQCRNQIVVEQPPYASLRSLIESKFAKK